MDRQIYKSKKTGGYYEILGECLNATNSQNGQVMIRYRRFEGGEGIEYVREFKEFHEKFEFYSIADESTS